MKHPNEMQINLEKFHSICEAYEVLSEPRLKIVYDQHGEDLLRTGVKDKTGSYVGGYVYQQNCYEIFDKFFLEVNAFHGVFDGTGTKLQGSMFGSAFGGAKAPLAGAVGEVKIDVPVTVAEFYNGCVKDVTYERQVVALDGHTARQEECVKTFVIKAGMAAGTKLRFRGDGNQQLKREPTDLIVTLVDAPNDGRTVRRGNDLIHSCQVTLQQALRSEPAQVVTLDGRLLKVSVDEVITPKTVVRLEGEGMPIPHDKDSDVLEPLRRGDMFVKFNIQFPKKLTDLQRRNIEAVLVQP